MFSYCENNPVNCSDPTGEILDTVLDAAFICMDVVAIICGHGYKKWSNWAALLADIAFAAIPFATGGGQIIRYADKMVGSISKVTVVGETMTRVKGFAKICGATENLYEGFKAYNQLSEKGMRVVAEILGKCSNAGWLYDKLRKGYKVVDIGIDLNRSIRSSSYAMESIILFTWESRNMIKGLLHCINGEK